jgi:hypothetical protein
MEDGALGPSSIQPQAMTMQANPARQQTRNTSLSFREMRRGLALAGNLEFFITNPFLV